jgi:drug/metabolite transporter (DMT)-like permease
LTIGRPGQSVTPAPAEQDIRTTLVGSIRASELALILATSAIHAGGWIAAGIAVAAVAPLTLASLRFVIAGTILVAAARIRGSSLGTANLPALLAVSVIGVSLTHTLLYTGLQLAPPADGVVLSTALTPVLAALIAAPILGERLSRRKLAGVIVSAGGVALVVIDAGALGASGNRLLGDALVIAGAVASALYTVLGGIAMRTGSPLGVVASTTLIGGLVLAPFALLESVSTVGRSWTFEVWLAFLYLTFPSAGLSAVMYYALIRRSGASRASLVAYLAPVIVLAWSALVQGEPLTGARVGGAILAIAGVRLVLSAAPARATAVTDREIGRRRT